MNNTKKDKETPLEALLTNNDVTATATVTVVDQNNKSQSHTVKPSQDKKTGNWTFDDSYGIDDSKTQYTISNVTFTFTNKCDETQTFVTQYRFPHKQNIWTWIVREETEDVILEGLIKRRKINGIEIGNGGSTISINEGNIEINDNSSFKMSFNTTPMVSSDKVSILMTYTDCKKNTKNARTEAKQNEKTNQYEVTTSIDANKACVWTLNSVTITIIDEERDTTYFETNEKLATTMDGKTPVIIVEKTGKGKYVSACNTSYKLKEVNLNTSTVSDIYAFNVSYKLEKMSEKDAPLFGIMLVELTNCNNETKFVKLEVKYSEKAGLYVGSGKIANAKGCNYNVTNIAIATITSCKDIAFWEATPKRNESTIKVNKPGIPESFNVLLHELRGLALEVTLD